MVLMRTVSQTPLGDMILLAHDRTLMALMWADGFERMERHLHRHLDRWQSRSADEIPGWSAALDAYWLGHKTPFHDLPMAPPGTPFQQRVWDALRTISFGNTWSYAKLADAIGQPTAHRAVANANGRNPIPIAIPCHRVIASNGQLGGFSGGLEKKLRLLNHEGHDFCG